MSFSNYAETAVLNHFFKSTSYTQPTHLYVGLATVTIGETDTGSTVTEADYTSYARVEFDTWTISGNSVSNNGAITFPQSTGGSNTVTDFFIADASTAGNIIAYGALTTSKSIASGDTPSFASGQLSATLD